MCNLSQNVEEKGIEKGIVKGIAIGIEEGREKEILRSLQTLMKNMEMPVEEALSTLEIPETDWQKYCKLLAGQ